MRAEGLEAGTDLGIEFRLSARVGQMTGRTANVDGGFSYALVMWARARQERAAAMLAGGSCVHLAHIRSCHRLSPAQKVTHSVSCLASRLTE
jgi:hypothetical protein